MSVPPPGWVEPPRAVASRAPSATDELRTEDRRALDGKRVRARLVDWLIVAPLTGAAIWAWGLNIGTLAISQCLLLILHHVCEVTTGATPGKRLLGLRVASLRDGGLPTPRQAAARGVIGIFEIGLIGIISIICTKGRQRLGDLAAGTVVVDARKHPVARRPLFRGALSYPVVWALPTLAACALASYGALPGTYRHDADAVCASVSTALRGFSPPAVGATRKADFVAVQRDEAVLEGLRSVPASAAWSARRDDLVRRLSVRVMENRTMVYDLVRPGGVELRPMWEARTRRRLADDDAALAAEGFHACAHRA